MSHPSCATHAAQVYLATDTLPYMPLILSLFTTLTLAKMCYSPSLATIATSSRTFGTDEAVDGAPLALGILTFRKQACFLIAS